MLKFCIISFKIGWLVLFLSTFEQDIYIIFMYGIYMILISTLESDLFCLNSPVYLFQLIITKFPNLSSVLQWCKICPIRQSRIRGNFEVSGEILMKKFIYYNIIKYLSPISAKEKIFPGIRKNYISLAEIKTPSLSDCYKAQQSIHLLWN